MAKRIRGLFVADWILQDGGLKQLNIWVLHQWIAQPDYTQPLQNTTESCKEELQNFSKLGKVKIKTRRDVKSVLAVEPTVFRKKTKTKTKKYYCSYNTQLKNSCVIKLGSNETEF